MTTNYKTWSLEALRNKLRWLKKDTSDADTRAEIILIEKELARRGKA